MQLLSRLVAACLAACLCVAVIITVPSLAKAAGEIIHDAEHYVLAAQHGERWAKEDKEISAKLAEIRKILPHLSVRQAQCVAQLLGANRLLFLLTA